MKNENIHNGFSEKEVRDFLAQELRESQKEGGFVSVEYAEEQIKNFQKILKRAKKFEAVKCLMALRGWEDLDISEWVSYNSETYFPFIGTEEERSKLLATLKEATKENDRQT